MAATACPSSSSSQAHSSPASSGAGSGRWASNGAGGCSTGGTGDGGSTCCSGEPAEGDFTRRGPREGTAPALWPGPTTSPLGSPSGAAS
eukprot:CAMPEP_0171087400 /NCGR_PEP_ID=MMETSP0766_2-20121228/20122_1 /TAXON_ID=439317 /ORGANISM="Gambierdiscus australes, Strain CAWD 149" /LENGTH=88 /DNA_ID=CAMNT_0011545099 /DNA_START=209 /DNA_END=475 /DNA_ORIENTATION=-